MAIYTDLDLFLVKNDITDDIVFKQDVYAVAQSVKNITLTKKGEGLFSPNFGSTLLESLSTMKDDIELLVIKDRVKAEIETQEPRAIINNIEITHNVEGYDVKIYFTMINTQQEGAVSFTV